MHCFPFTLIFLSTLFIFFTFPITLAQQPYIGLATNACPRRGNSNSIRGYTCNGGSANHTCQAYLTFRTQPIYNSVYTISTLLSSDARHLAETMSVSQNTTFETNKLVIVPVQCSCAGEYYQANTSYAFQNTDTPFSIANNTFEGLTTCQALMHENHNPGHLYLGRELTVPLRCACPTKNQTEKGIKYLLSYLVNWGDSVSVISEKFGVSCNNTLEANSLSLTKAKIYPFTTLLVPLHDKPSNSQTILQSQPSSTSSSPPPSSSTHQSSNKTWLYVVVGGVFALIVLTAVIFCIHYHKGRKKDDSLSQLTVSESFENQQLGKEMKKGDGKLSEFIHGIAQSFKVYSFEEIQRATNNLNSSSLIKGSVYRGVMNGDLVAIKKTEGDVSKEIQILNKVNHSNVIRLSGVSFNEGQWYLVYEYAANGPLSEWIFFGKFLSWTQRIQIALDVAIGLDYLHSFTSPPHIHKDLKSSNILLDSDFRAKIANLSLARSVKGVDEDDQFLATRNIVGTRGYMAPEYLENGLVSTKLDVYAFGVLMLEILTGKEVAAILAEDNNKNLSGVLSAVLGEERLKEFMDPSLQSNYPFELAMFVFEIIVGCIEKDPASRPSMQEIVPTLSRTMNSSLSWEMSVNISG
uniref:LysM type receptor kinase n=2 Tax=Lotus japonicus TaxID=34305 RepID=D3KTZ9_LOTJA|nr:LysM type receptor kinase [Lotus japonicus]